VLQGTFSQPDRAHEKAGTGTEGTGKQGEPMGDANRQGMGEGGVAIMTPQPQQHPLFGKCPICKKDMFWNQWTEHWYCKDHGHFDSDVYLSSRTAPETTRYPKDCENSGRFSDCTVKGSCVNCSSWQLHIPAPTDEQCRICSEDIAAQARERVLDDLREWFIKNKCNGCPYGRNLLDKIKSLRGEP